jgi:hypothetical protein
MSEARQGSLIEQVRLNSVVRLPDGRIAQIVAQRKKERRTYIYVEAYENAWLPFETDVEVVATPADLALAYVLRPAMRPMVHGAVAEARRRGAQALSDLLDARPRDRE